jgi:hypothetical protein
MLSLFLLQDTVYIYLGACFMLYDLLCVTVHGKVFVIGFREGRESLIAGFSECQILFSKVGGVFNLLDVAVENIVFFLTSCWILCSYIMFEIWDGCQSTDIIWVDSALVCVFLSFLR